MDFFFPSTHEGTKLTLHHALSRYACLSEALCGEQELTGATLAVVPGQALGLWDNVGVPREKWGTQVEPGPEWYNNASAPR